MRRADLDYSISEQIRLRFGRLSVVRSGDWVMRLASHRTLEFLNQLHQARSLAHFSALRCQSFGVRGSQLHQGG